MARLTDEERSFIKEYVDSKYYDIGKLLSYLEMHQMVGNEIFSYVYKGNWEFEARRHNVHTWILRQDTIL